MKQIYILIGGQEKVYMVSLFPKMHLSFFLSATGVGGIEKFAYVQYMEVMKRVPTFGRVCLVGASLQTELTIGNLSPQ